MTTLKPHFKIISLSYFYPVRYPGKKTNWHLLGVVHKIEMAKTEYNVFKTVIYELLTWNSNRGPRDNN